MEIKVQSIKFDADQKLLDFIDKKLGKMDRYYEDATVAEVTLSLLSDHNNKNVKVRVFVPSDEIIVERNADTFENAVTEVAGIVKDSLVSAKERKLK